MLFAKKPLHAFCFSRPKKKSLSIPYHFSSITILKPLFKKPLTQNSEWKYYLSEKEWQSTFFPQYTVTTLSGR